ncbi:hypothetical protein CF319_g2170 [Tilletia indica]|nr:hypothetical protein CF319_g2170 [Tilletia indica]
MSTAQVESRPTPSAATAYDTPATTSANHNANATGSGAPGEAAHQRQGGGAGGAGGGRDRRRRGKGPAGGAAESDNHGQGRGGGRGGGGGGGGGGGASAEVNADRAAQQQNGNRNQGSSNRSANNGRGRGNGRPARGNATGSARAHVEAGIENAAANSGGNGGRQRQGRGKPKENAPAAAPSSSAEAGAPAAAEPTVSSRKRNFGGKITTGEAATTSRGGADVKGKGVAQAYVPPIIREYADLRSRLVAELGSGSYECSICYNTLTTRQPCWSCDQRIPKCALDAVHGDVQDASSRARTCHRRTGAGVDASKNPSREEGSTHIHAVNAAPRAHALTVAVRSPVILVHALHAPSPCRSDATAGSIHSPYDALRSTRRHAPAELGFSLA